MYILIIFSGDFLLWDKELGNKLGPVWGLTQLALDGWQVSKKFEEYHLQNLNLDIILFPK